MFYQAGIFITFFLVLILMMKKGKTVSDKVLAIWLAVIGIHLFFYYGYITGKIYDYPFLLGIQIPMPLLQGPLLYIYTLSITRYDGFNKKYLVHFIVPALTYLFLLNFFMLPSADKIFVFRHEGLGYELESRIIVIASIISGFTYVLLSFYELRKYRKRIAEEFSDTEKMNLNWLRYLICGILVIWLTILFNGYDEVIFGAVVVFVLLLGYFGITHVGIFTYRQIAMAAKKEIQVAAKETPPESNAPSVTTEATTATHAATEQKPLRVRYEKSSVQKEVAERIHGDLQQLMKTQKIFKQEELSLAQLAEQLGVHPNNLSQVINTYENKSFYDYVNALRIEEFKTLAAMPGSERFTFLSLAFECGFNSKTSFNRNFKKITGQSPSAYLKRVNVQLLQQ